MEVGAVVDAGVCAGGVGVRDMVCRGVQATISTIMATITPSHNLYIFCIMTSTSFYFVWINGIGLFPGLAFPQLRKVSCIIKLFDFIHVFEAKVYRAAEVNACTGGKKIWNILPQCCVRG